jgi:hypothetical protein
MKRLFGIKRLSILFTALFLLSGLCGAANATPIINYSHAPGLNNFTSPYAGVTVQDFNDSTSLGWSGSFAVVTGSVSGKYAAPFGDTLADGTPYLTVPNPDTNGSGSATKTLGGINNYLGLWWGSVDTYNTIISKFNDTVVYSFNGSLLPSSNGNQVVGGSFYVNFLDLPNFDSFTLTSTEFAFEADNIAVGRVPEPSTLLLLGSGLLGLCGFKLRKKVRG